MTYIARRNRARCPNHPGALLREDVIPATGRTKSEIARLLGISRQHLYDTWANASRCRLLSRFASASCSAMAPEHGRACRRPTIPGMPSRKRM